MLRHPSSAGGGGATVTGNVFRALLEYASTRGHDPAHLAAHFGLSWDALQDLSARVPVATAQRLWAELPVLLDDDDLGVHLAEFLAPQGGLLPMLVLTTASTVGEGITRAMELQRMLAAGGAGVSPIGPADFRPLNVVPLRAADGVATDAAALPPREALMPPGAADNKYLAQLFSASAGADGGSDEAFRRALVARTLAHSTMLCTRIDAALT